MNVNVRKMEGPWDLGFSLDKHTAKSVYKGENEFGHPIFETTRTEVGEALFQLKYRSGQSGIATLGDQLVTSLGGYFKTASIVVPMPPSKSRRVQPLTEIARHVSEKMGLACREDLLLKAGNTPQMKDIPNRQDRLDALSKVLKVADVLQKGDTDVILIDDLLDTGASLEAATATLRSYDKIRKVFIAALTRTRDS